MIIPTDKQEAVMMLAQYVLRLESRVIALEERNAKMSKGARELQRKWAREDVERLAKI